VGGVHSHARIASLVGGCSVQGVGVGFRVGLYFFLFFLSLGTRGWGIYACCCLPLSGRV